MSKARIIHELHDDLGVTLSEAEKAYDIAVEYIRLRSAIGDHPEDYIPSEYVLVKASAQPERKTGRWIKMSDADGYYYVCDQCGEELPRYTIESPTWDNPYPPKYSINKTSFCSNCGADMRGKQDG